MKVWSDVRAALALVSARDRRVLVLVSVLQASLALLDLVAVILIGLVALIAAGAATGEVPPLIDRAMQAFGVSQDDPYTLAVALAVVAGLLMVAKSALSFFVTRRVFGLLANRQAMISSKLASQLLTQPLLDLQRRSSQEVGYALTVGVNAITLGVLGQAVVIVAEASLLLAFAVGLFFIDPIVTLFTVIFFAVVGLGLHKLIAGWTERLGRESSDTQIESYEAVQEVLRTYREVSVMGRRGMFVERFRDLRWVAARVQANLQVMGQVSKYVFEVALIVGGALLAA
ncbi:MAG: ABC transporter transmembrane domain-containing protein, partial [bacterium]|nr:ABC transporter transmembrane domain-containing protein [bacterium]